MTKSEFIEKYGGQLMTFSWYRNHVFNFRAEVVRHPIIIKVNGAGPCGQIWVDTNPISLNDLFMSYPILSVWMENEDGVMEKLELSDD